MTRYRFYDSPEYKAKQATHAKNAWTRGVYVHRIAASEIRQCQRSGCTKTFQVVAYDPKVFCSHTCAAIVGNAKRAGPTLETRQKIAVAMTGLPNANKGKILVPRVQGECPRCGVIFRFPRWAKRQYCSAGCAIRDVGSRPTSPRAARAKAGVRLDIDPNLYFFSRWEANFARILNFKGIAWKFQPKRFQLETQKYTPDFYLPALDEYIEIKNFLSDYSKRRDDEFRKCFPHVKLTLILKSDYLELQKQFAPLINTWEYSKM
jgi:hypothetical protein